MTLILPLTLSSTEHCTLTLEARRLVFYGILIQTVLYALTGDSSTGQTLDNYTMQSAS